jgi:hypothetical protein
MKALLDSESAWEVMIFFYENGISQKKAADRKQKDVVVFRGRQPSVGGEPRGLASLPHYQSFTITLYFYIKNTHTAHVVSTEGH